MSKDQVLAKMELVEQLKKRVKRIWYCQYPCVFWIANSFLRSDFRLHVDSNHLMRAAFGALPLAILFSFNLILKRKLRVAEENLKATLPSYTSTHWLNARI